jgi:ABC-type amino acid transport substrate-binding protein
MCCFYEKRKKQHVNKFSLFSQRVFPNFEFLDECALDDLHAKTMIMNRNVSKELIMYRKFAKTIVILICFLALSSCRQNNHGSSLDIHHLNGKRIGVVLAWSSDYVLDKRDDLNIFRYDKMADAILALKYKKIDALAMDLFFANYYCSIQPGFRYFETPIGYDHFVIFVNRNRKDLLNLFNQFASDFQKSQAYREIYKKIMQMKDGNYESYVFPHPQDAPVIKIAVDPLSPPYSGYDLLTHEIEGCDVDMIRLFADQYGFRTEFIPSTYDGQIMNLKSGKADIMITALSEIYQKYAQLSNDYLVSRTYTEMPIVLIVPEN